ncbi:MULTISPECIES: RsiV family protein [unclassified Bradyrhizobium]|uniref:RsiV family protein n=1 Tax=unclassified Bradyrhizobium TaxID=2631580 RepID=UPI0028E7EE1B|nr:MULTISPECIES: RsiV family protein [unclassified Bradyrhizobium]
MYSNKLLVAALFGLLTLSPAIAAEAKPDASIKTKAAEASVTLSADIKADPALAANCLAEGRKWMDKQAADAAKDYKADKELFRDGPYTYGRDYSVRSIVADRYVSVLRNDYMDTHGAHPNRTVDTILWDKAAAKRISIRPFFNETADNGPTMTAISKAIIASLRAEKKARDAGDTDEWWLKSVEPKLLGIGAVTLAPSTLAGKSSGLTFHYPPYAVGAYAEGDYVAFVPWETLKPYLSAEGQAIFGGARPKGDAEEN